MNSYKNDYKIVMESSVTDGLFDSIQTYEYTKFENVYQQQKRFNEVHEYNIAVMGISQAGQTSLCKRLSKNTFSKTLWLKDADQDAISKLLSFSCLSLNLSYASLNFCQYYSNFTPKFNCINMTSQQLKFVTKQLSLQHTIRATNMILFHHIYNTCGDLLPNLVYRNAQMAVMNIEINYINML
ncbi:Hypothetical_protein [Hexamita inflata]|uniref:Hypothetical_protein n=1 Tax=Hexamita inflata TaxID=28002 RepID=A0AA86TGQ0_9EUKA|nr:Hypothetical protein HINF_LOCUS5714 [Hexamita inflata]